VSDTSNSGVTPASRERLLPAFFLGAIAAVVASSVLIAIDPRTSFVPHLLVYGVSLLLAAFLAIRFAPSRLIEVGVHLYIGMAVGVTAHALIYEGLGYGSRNLFPFEIAMFSLFGFVPTVVGLWLGRRTWQRVA
jgi:uncharacterized membrane protein YoaK (UPF0700 family)